MRLLPTLLLLAASVSAQSNSSVTMQPAPELALAQILQAPANSGFTWENLRGKAVVLEFWATWCGGCVAQIPHLNALAAQFKDQPVVFLSVTDEDPEPVKAFLKKRHMDSWIGIDKDGATFRNFSIEGRPQTFLINGQGEVWSRMAPDRLDEARLKRLIDGAPPELDSRLNTPKITPMELVHGVPSPLLQVMIRPAAPISVSSFGPGAKAEEEGGRVEYFGITLKSLVAIVKDMRDDRIVAPEWANMVRYDVSSVVPEGREQLRAHLIDQMLENTFELQTVRESRPTPVFVLRCTAACRTKLQPASAKPSKGSLPNPGQYIGESTKILRLIGIVEGEANGVEVIDETGISGTYQVELSWHAGDLESLRSALRAKLGFDLTKEVRNREFLVITSATQPLTW